MKHKSLGCVTQRDSGFGGKLLNMNRAKVLKGVFRTAVVAVVGITVWGCNTKGGCNDPLADNYDPSANRYGECVYTIDKEDTVVPESNIPVNIKIEATANGKDFALNEKYTNNDGKEFLMSTLKFYVANLKFAYNGNNKTEFKDIELFDFDTSKPLNPSIPYWNTESKGVVQRLGSYNQLYIGVGVGIEENEEFSPNKYPADHPLSATYTTMAWDWKAKYIFSKIEGRVDSNANGILNRTFFYHSGHSDMYRLVILDLDKTYEIGVNNEVDLELNLDVLKIIDGIKIETSAQGQSHTSTPAQKVLSSAVHTNLSEAISVKNITVHTVILN
ncbi:MAG: hypothetical protein CL840_17505 [Crocinitomicaceae bacterium]|nr:hypothetical protein [Crocinitomicaceae bacterium]|tara:strand:+ start:17457 stop:18446 length:990 start_codon:yes stop_codon:yes gene_type:complete